MRKLTCSLVLFSIWGLLSSVSFSQEKSHRIFFDANPVPLPEIFNWIQKTNFATGFVVHWTTTEKDLRTLHQMGYEVALHMWANPDTRYREDNANNTPPENRQRVHEILNRHIAAADGDHSKVIWEMFVEDESAGVAFPYEMLLKKPSTHAAAYQLFEEYLRKSIEAAEPYGNIIRWATPGYAGSAHQFARQKEVDLVGVERSNDDVDDIQTGIAFARGAARQYNKKWGLDFSLWWGVIYGGVGQLPTSYHKRLLYTSYFSGSGQSRLEGVGAMWDADKKDLSPYGKCIDEFGRFTLSHKPGKPETLVAVILPKDHGWNTPPYWRTTSTAWNYAHIPYRQGQKAIDGFFGYAFPGSNYVMDPFPFGKYGSDDPPASPFALSCVTPKYAPAPEDVYYAEPPLPFGKYKDRIEAGKDLEMNHTETGLYRPMGDSRWGDIIDVFTDDVSADILKEYRVIVLLDQIKLDAGLQQRLSEAMNNGSTVITAVGVVTPDNQAFSGSELIPELRVGRSWSFNKVEQREMYRYVPSRASGANIIAGTDEGYPLLIEKIYGKGKLITSLVPWFEGNFATLNGSVMALLDEVIQPLQPVLVEGPSIEFLSSAGNDRYTVLLTNNSSLPWKGKVRARNVSRDYGRCTELLTGEELASKKTKNQEVLVELTVPPFEVRAVSWSK